MRSIALLLSAACLLPSDARANQTQLYFRMSTTLGRFLSTTAPTESGASCGSPGNGCQSIGNLGVACGTNSRKDSVQNPSFQFKFVTTEALGKDPGFNDTQFKYYAYNVAAKGFTQPMFQVTYLYNDAPKTVITDRQEPPCIGCAACSIDATYTIANPIEIDKASGLHVQNTSTLSAPLLSSLPIGSTILVDFWVADGDQDAGVVSSVANKSYLLIPYSKDNFSVYGSMKTQYFLQGAANSSTFVLDNTHVSAPDISSVDIRIPANLGGPTGFFSAVSVGAITGAAGVATVTQATASTDGSIHVAFSPNVSKGAIVSIPFDVTASGATAESVKWDASVNGPLMSNVIVAERSLDSLRTAVLPAPTMPTSVLVTPVNTTAGGGQLAVSWNGPALFDLYAVTAYQVFRSTGGPFGQIGTVGPIGLASWTPQTAIHTAPTGVSFTDIGLTNGMAFSYRLTTVNPVGTSGFTAAISGTPYAAPAAPAYLSALVRNQAADLIWAPSAGGTFALSGYRLFRSTCATCTIKFSGTVWGGTASVYTDSALSNSALHSWQVLGFDDQGHAGAASPTGTGRPPVNPPTGLTPGYDYAVASVALQWQSSIRNVYPVTAYRVYRSTCPTCPLGALSTTFYAGATVFLDAAVTVGKLYFYAASALSEEGGPPFTEGALTSPLVRYLTPPAPPTALTVKAAPGATLFVSWADPNSSSVVTGYVLEMSTQSAAGPYVVQSSPFLGTTSYLHTGIQPGGGLLGQRYYYRVSAYFFPPPFTDYAQSPPGPVVSLPLEPSAPSALTGVAADKIVRLVWANLSGTQEVDSYRIYRSSVPGIPGATVFVGSALSPPAGTATVAFDDVWVTDALTYTYRVTALNVGGEGPPVSTLNLTPFVPPGLPGFLTVASSISQLKLFWSPATPSVGGFPIAGYEIWRSTTSGAEINIGPFTSGTSLTDVTGVVNGRTYFYKVRPQDTMGNPGPFGNEASATAAIPPCPPSFATALASPADVALAWATVVSAGCAGPAVTLPVSGYAVYRSTFAGGGYATITTTAGATTYTDAAVVVGTTYYYAVRTFDTATPPNESVQLFSPFAPAYSVPDAVATPRVPALAPGGLTTLGVGSEHDGKLKVSWVPAVAGTFPVLGYNVYRSTTVGGPESKIYVSGGAADVYLDLNLTNGRFYYYRVAAQEDRGFEGGWAGATGTPYTDPGVPTALTLLAGDATVTVGWTPPMDTTYSVAGFQVLRATWPGVVGLSVVGPDPYVGVSFADTGVTNGTPVYYHVRTYDAEMHLGALSAEISGTPYASPAAPLGLTVLPGGTGTLRMTLSWNAAAAGTFAVSGYRLYRASYSGIACGAGGPPIATLTGGLLGYVDQPVVAANWYYYRVAAFDAATPSHASLCSVEVSSSAYASVDPPVKPNNLTAVPSPAQVVLAWTAGWGSVPAALSGYAIYRATFAARAPSATEYVALLTGSNSASNYDGANGYTDAALPNGFTYYYSVRARDDSYLLAGSGTYYSDASNEVVAFPAAVPAGLTTSAPAADLVRLQWAPTAAAPGGLPVTGYRIFRATGATGPYGFLALSGADAFATTYDDGAVANGTPYWYRVAALHQLGWTSALSATAMGVPAGPPSAPTLAVTPGDGRVGLGWTLASATFAPVTSYRVYRGLAAGFTPGATSATVFAPGAPGTTGYADLTVANGTGYYYRVAALDSDWLGGPNETLSNEVYGVPLGVPTGLSAAGGNNKITLKWALPAAATGISGYQVYRAAPPQPEVLLGFAWGNASTVYLDNTAVNGTLYIYRLRAADRNAPPINVGQYSATVAGTSGVPPSSPVIDRANPGNSRIDLAWSPPSVLGSNPLGGYKLFRSSGGGPYALLSTFGVSTTFFTDLAVTNGVTWSYQLSAFDNGAPPLEGPLSNVKSAVPFAIPNPPTVLTTQVGNGTLMIGWSTAFVQSTLPILGYFIYRGVSPNGEGATPINVFLLATGTYYVDPTPPQSAPAPTNGVTWYYKVQARDTSGHDSILSAETFGTPFAPPPAPGGLTVLPGNLANLVSWSTTNGGTYPAAGYNVYRADCPACTPQLLGALTGTLFVDTGVTNGVPVWYSIRTRDALGHEGAGSATASETPLATIVNPPLAVGAVIGGGSITVAWTGTLAGAPPGGPVSEYLVLKSTCAACGFLSASVYVAGAAVPLAWTDTQAASGSFARYAVRSVANGSAYSDDYAWTVVTILSACAPPGSPTGLAATTAFGTAGLTLTWGPSTPGCAGDVVTYAVLRNGTPLAGATALSTSFYADLTAVGGTAYTYVVVATGLGGTATSAPVTITPPVRESQAYLSANAFAPLRGERLKVPFTLEKAGEVTFTIYTMAGLKVLEQTMTAGTYDEFRDAAGLPGWDGTGTDGKAVASGLYLIEVRSGSFRKLLKVLVVK